MSTFDRALLALYAFVSALLSLFILFLAMSGNVPYYLQLAFRSPDQRVVIGISAVIFFIISIRLLFSTFGGKRKDQALIEDNALGQVRITLAALENLVKKVAFQVPGVREVKPKLLGSPQGMKLLLKVTVTPDIPVPHASQELQEKVKAELLRIAGIELGEVRVLVDSISADLKSRVE